jgi:Fe-S cluster assembly protein SufD
MTAHAAARSTAEAKLAEQFQASKMLTRSPQRAAAFERFAASGLPTRRVESWHYTDLRAAMTDAAPIAPSPDRSAIEAAKALLTCREKTGVSRVVTVNGRFAPELSDPLPTGASVSRREARASGAEDPMASLVEAMAPDVLAVDVAAGVDLAGPVEITHVAIGEGAYSLYSWTEVAVGAGARATVAETFVGASAAVQRHAATTLKLAEGAKLKHVAVVDDDSELHVESQLVDLEAQAELNAFGFVSGGSLTRRQIFAKLRGKDAKIALGGLALLDRTRRSDTTLHVIHDAPRGTSREFYRAIVTDDAAGVFQGKVVVARGAQKTDGAMKSQAVLLSPQAQMNAKPELEIFADDVVCGHGATVASIDPEQIFYLQTRGIPKGEAEAMLLQAFGVDAIQRIEDEAMVDALRTLLAAWLDGGRTAKATQNGMTEVGA